MVFNFGEEGDHNTFLFFLPYISLVLNPVGMQIARARAIQEKSSEKTCREKTVRGTKNLVK